MFSWTAAQSISNVWDRQVEKQQWRRGLHSCPTDMAGSVLFLSESLSKHITTLDLFIHNETGNKIQFGTTFGMIEPAKWIYIKFISVPVEVHLIILNCAQKLLERDDSWIVKIRCFVFKWWTQCLPTGLGMIRQTRCTNVTKLRCHSCKTKFYAHCQRSTRGIIYK